MPTGQWVFIVVALKRDWRDIDCVSAPESSEPFQAFPHVFQVNP
jgi:hypothetical protein